MLGETRYFVCALKSAQNRGAVKHSLLRDRITDGAAINEILFGQDYGFLKEVGTELNFDLHDCYICLTGIPKKIYASIFNRNYTDFFQIYDMLRNDISEKFKDLGICFDTAAIKYDQSKRICCIMTIPKQSSMSALDAASFIHQRMKEIYKTQWMIDDFDYVFVTALSEHISGFDKLQPGFQAVRKMANLAFFIESSRLMTDKIYHELYKPFPSQSLAISLKEIELCLVKADTKKLDSALESLFFTDIRYSFSIQMCDYTLAGLRRLAERYDEIYMANIDHNRFESMNARSHPNLRTVYEETRSVLYDCAKASLQTGVEVSQISLEAIQYLRNNHRKAITVEAIAEHIGVSPTYLSRVFNKEVGENIPSYLTKVRLNRARFLLETTDANVSSIAKRVGFNNAQYFNHLFKQKAGITPARYRAERKNGSF